MKREKLAAIGSVFAAVAASICCIGPLVAVVLGVGSLAAASGLNRWRPVFLGVTFVLLALAWYLTYRKPKVEGCADGGVCATRPGGKWGSVILWVATGLAIVLAALPLYAGAIARWLHREEPAVGASQSASVATVKVRIPSMDCEACAGNIQRTLLKKGGILRAKVTFKAKEAVVEYDAGKISPAQIVVAIDETGFRAEPVTQLERR
jgi:mercuric ion transport protein